MENLSGKLVKSYELAERIGTGGFGAVYRGVQPTIGREVAVKVILPEHANHPDFIRRFETEAQIIARLEHPHIVPLYDYWREPNSAYLVMRYLRGGSLRDSIEAHGAWEPAAVAPILNQIATALTFAHHNNVIHRDLKSDNILLDELGNAYLTDFGIAKDLGGGLDLTRDAILGTPAYLSPEQIRGEMVSPQSDIYALGILCYEILTGSKPFFDSSPATVLFQHLNDPIPDLRDTNAQLPAALNDVIQRATAKDSDLRYHTAIEFARAFQSVVRDSLPGLPTQASERTAAGRSITDAEKELFQPPNPYKGLRAFQQADALDFYGRDHLVQRLLERLKEREENNRFLAVVGPSGSGKSSVIKAGLLPSIRAGRLDSEVDWYITEMIPGTHPLEELEAALLGIAPVEMPGLLTQLREDERGLLRAVKRILPGEDAELVLFIDQFEEIFTLVSDETEREHFLNSLLAAVEDQRGRMRIVVTIRADFYDRPLLYSAFGELIRQRTELVLPLSAEELEEAISAPARRVGVQLEPGLINAIINDVNEQPGALPMLQYALTELFERREGHMLTLSAYEEIGGTSGALARRAEELYAQLTPDEQKAAREMFLRLVTPGEGTEDTRRRVFQAELLSIDERRETMRKVIDLFGKYRLLTFDHDPQTRQSTVEVAHEALIRQWTRMRQWLDENRESLRLQRRLTTLAQEWRQSDNDPSFLARGIRLRQFEEWAQHSGLALNEQEEAYLQASIAEREQRLAIERERQEREAALERQLRNRWRLTAAVMGIAAVIGLVLAAFALNQRSIAEDNARTAAEALSSAERNAAEASSLALAANARNAQAEERNPALALALALSAAERFSPVPVEVRRTLADAVYAPGPVDLYRGHSASVVSTAFVPGGRYGVTSSVDGTIRIWDLTTGELHRVIDLNPDSDEPLPALYAHVIAVHPEGTHILGGLSDGSLRLWDFESGEETLRLEGHEDAVLDAAFSPNGLFAVSGGLDRTIRKWGLASGDELLRIDGHSGVVLQVGFSPDGRRIFSGAGDATLADDPNDREDRTARLWDAQSGDQLLRIAPQSGYVRAVAMHPDGSMLAIGVWDSADSGTVRLYDTNTGQEINRFFAHSTSITAVSFTPDGGHVISAAWDKTLRVWDTVRGVQALHFTGFEDRILAVDIDAGGEYLLIGQGNTGNDAYSPETEAAIATGVWLWDLRSRDEGLAFDGHQDWLWTVDISPDGETVATAGGPLRLPSVEQGEDLPRLDTDIHLWDLATGEALRRLRGHNNTVDSVAFHPDGETLLSGAWDGLIIRWDVESGERLQLYRQHRGRVYDVSFNADGSEFLSAGGDTRAGDARNDNIALRWDADTGAVLGIYRGHQGHVHSAVFSPDETLVATGSADGTARLWDLASGQIVHVLEGHEAAVNEVRFSPDGRTVATSSWDDTIRLWDVETGREIRQFTGHNGHTFGLAFSEDGQILLSTSEDQTVRMWDVSTGEELHRFSGHTDWVQEIVFSPDEQLAISAGQDMTARVWHIHRTTAELRAFAEEHRYIRPFTCAERERYRLEPCAQQAGAAEAASG